MAAEPLVRVIRSGFEESVHVGHVAVCDARGSLLWFAGDPDRPVFARSSMKPLQAAVSVAAAGEEDLSEAEVAVACGSHSGEPIHVEAVWRLLARAGLGFEALRCPADWPLDEATARTVTGPRAELHNCSGKHAAMLLACVRNGWDVEAYPHADHPLQRRVLEAVREASGAREVAVGVDGCGVPVHGVPLRAMATLFARMARPEGLGDLRPRVERAVRAMLAEPYLVAGRDRLDTAVMAEAGHVAAKAGAEGLRCAAVLGPGLGVAVKVEDGSPRAAGPALLRALRLLDAIGDAHLQALERHARPPVLGGGRPVGELVADFELGAP